MRITYDKLWRILTERNLEPYTTFFTNNRLDSVTYMKMRYNQSVSLLTIDRICTALQIQPGDFMSVVTDEEYEKISEQIKQSKKPGKSTGSVKPSEA